MLTTRRPGFRLRLLPAVLALALIGQVVPGLTPSALAAPADEPTDTTPIGDGGSGGVGDYINVGLQDPSGNTEVTVDATNMDPCVGYAGLVDPRDIPPELHQPSGAGHWVYRLCAKDAATARHYASRYPTLGAAKANCTHDKDRPEVNADNLCALVVTWKPDEERRPRLDEGRGGYFSKFLTLAPDLSTQPIRGPNDGLIVNFPSWFWLNNTTTFPFIVPDFGLFGGGVATAWHLNSHIDADGGTRCNVSGLRKVGTDYNDWHGPPEAPSPSRCGYTFPRQGIYNIHSCSQWLIVVAFTFFVVAFPITFCNNDNATVKEAQVVVGGGPVQAPVR